jgi:hypothetical protein
VGGQFIDIATATGIVIARHELLADGLGATVRDTGRDVLADGQPATSVLARRGVVLQPLLRSDAPSRDLPPVRS